MIDNQPSIYNGTSIYNQCGGIGIDILDYFDLLPVYWDSTVSQFQAIYIGNLSNTNLRIKGTFYSPNGALRGSLFRICTGSYTDRAITVQWQNSSGFVLNNGDAGSYSGNIDLIGKYDIDIYRDQFKLNTNSYTGGYASITRNYIFPLPLAIGNQAYSESKKSALIRLQLIDEQTNKILFDYLGAKRKRDNAPCIIDAANSNGIYNSNLKNYAMP